MIKHFKILSIIGTIIIYLLFNSITVQATSIPVGIDPGTMEFGEFCSWVMLLFGVHGETNNPSRDYWNDSDYKEYLESEWVHTKEWTEYGHTYQECLRNMYQEYLDAKYKMAISRSIYDSFSEAIKRVFNNLPEITVEFQGDETLGQYTSQSTINQLKSMYNQSFFDELSNNIDWTTYWNQQQNNIKGIYSNINFYQEYSTYTRVQYFIYFNRGNDFNIDIANQKLIFTSGNVDRFNLDCYIYQNNTHAMYISKTTNISSPITYVNTIDTIYKDSSTYGKILIDSGIQSLIDTDTNTLVTSYTDNVAADTIEVAIPSDVSRILTDVQDKVISVSQAITQAQAVVVDKTDTQAVTQAQATVASDIPQFQTVGLSDLFPFCIPFDFIRFLSAFSDEPKTPEFDIQLPTGIKINGELQWYTQHVDFHQFDTIAMITRDIELVLFCVGLCLVTRNIMIRS